MNVRKTALSLLRDAEAGDKYIALTLDGYLSANPCDARDRALLSALVYGTVERKLTLDYAIGALTHRTDVSPAARAILPAIKPPPQIRATINSMKLAFFSCIAAIYAPLSQLNKLYMIESVIARMRKH